MTLSITKMLHSDISEVFEFFRDLATEGAKMSFVEIETSKMLEGWVGDNPMVVIARDSRGIAGVAKGAIGEGNRSHSAMLAAAVRMDLRGQGIAEQVTSSLCEELAKAGITIARAYVYSDNKASIRSLEKMDFILDGRVIAHHFDEKTDEYIDDLIYHKDLKGLKI